MRMNVVRRWVIIITAIAAAPFIVLLGIHAYQVIVVWLRHPIDVRLHVTDQKGVAQSDVTLTFRENGWRYLVPIPFSESWMTDGTIKCVTTDASGDARVTFRDDYLRLEDLKLSNDRSPG